MKTINDFIFEAYKAKYPDMERWEFDSSIFQLDETQQEGINNFAREVAQASLNKAAENVKLERVDYFEASQEQHNNGVPYYYGEGDVPCELICVVKSSITDISNITI